MEDIIENYRTNLAKLLKSNQFDNIPKLVNIFKEAWKNQKTVFFCGNGGSLANAIHLANDFLYGAGKKEGIGIRTEALGANSAVLTCLANDVSYTKIFSEQLKVKGKAGDVLIALSGSGNSENIINALNEANEIGLTTVSILGFDGGKSKTLADLTFHFPINDMQVSEDMQMLVGHICMQILEKEGYSDQKF